MKVWVDGQCFQTLSRGRGIGRYVEGLLTALAQIEDVELMISFGTFAVDKALDAKERFAGIIPPENIHLWSSPVTQGQIPTGVDSARTLARYALSHHVNCLKPDIALSVSPFEGAMDAASPLLPGYGCEIPMVSIFYDAIPHRYPDKYLTTEENRTYYYERLNTYKDFDFNLGISDFATAELIDIFPGTKAESIYAGLSATFRELLANNKPGRMKKKYGDYLLYVGGDDWRKNVPMIFDAVKMLPRAKRRDLKLLLVGSQDDNVARGLHDKWRQLGLRPENLVSVTDAKNPASDEDVVALNADTLLAVQPSFMEGFGLTVLEAMAAGAPVTASNVGGTAELLRQPDFMFDPSEPGQLADILSKVLSGNVDLKEIAAKNHEISKEYTWENSARLTFGAITRLLGERQATPAPAGDPVQRSRQEIGKKIKALPFEFSDLVEIMSAAEVRADRNAGGRLLIEASRTSEEDHATGIQRVVRNLSYEMLDLMKEDGSSVGWQVVYFSDDDRSFYEIDAIRGQGVQKVERVDSKRLFPSLGDKLLMLDSTWIEQYFQRERFQAYAVNGVDVIICIYDLVPIKTPAFFDMWMPIHFSNWLKASLTYSNKFVAISRAVADELYDLLVAIDFPREIKLGYFQLGANLSEHDESEKKASKKKTSRPMFLMVGTIEPRKGHEVAIDAFTKFWEAGYDAELVIVGKEGWNIQHLIDKIESHPEFEKRLFWHERVSDSELVELYQRTDAMVASSYAEGFGLPIVEAGMHGKPVVASDIPVFREVSEGASGAVFFEVGNPEDLFEKLKQIDARGFPKVSGDAGAWPDWAESGRQMDEIIRQEKWYKTYTPKNAGIIDRNNREFENNTRALEEDERVHELTVQGAPFVDVVENVVKIVVKVTNRSNIAWSSTDMNGGAYSVCLSFHSHNANGDVVVYDNDRSRFLFAIGPDDTNYVPVKVPLDQIRAGVRSVHLEMVQESVGWWGGGIMVEFDDDLIEEILG